MTLAFSVGDPVAEGRYVVYAPCEALQVREWLEPEIAVWHGGRWHSRRPVWAWIGPLPVIHGDEVTRRLQPQEYDL